MSSIHGILVQAGQAHERLEATTDDGVGGEEVEVEDDDDAR